MNQTGSTCTRVYAKKPKTFQTFLKSFVTFDFSASPHKGIKNRAAYIIVNMYTTFTLTSDKK